MQVHQNDQYQEQMMLEDGVTGGGEQQRRELTFKVENVESGELLLHGGIVKYKTNRQGNSAATAQPRND